MAGSARKRKEARRSFGPTVDPLAANRTAVVYWAPNLFHLCPAGGSPPAISAPVDSSLALAWSASRDHPVAELRVTVDRTGYDDSQNDAR